ncbi:hypothetical protein LTR94_024166, partial [Friedmanniomyces endolithicus]
MLTAPTGNHLIQGMDSADRAALMAIATPVEFNQGHVFSEPDDLIEHLHFITQGIASSVAVLEDGRTVETVMVGKEGVLGVIASVVPHQARTRTVAQSAGTALRVDAAKFRQLALQTPGVREAVADFAARLQGELEQSTACNALHRAEQRFAKWLLRCHDRVEGDTLSLTQEYLASMLGSQRTTVNEAAQSLQKSGAIAYSRGR